MFADGEIEADFTTMGVKQVFRGPGHIIRTPQGWRIASYKLTVTFSDGDHRLMGIAYRKATSGADLPRRPVW